MKHPSRFFRFGGLLLFALAMICLVCYDVYGGLWLKGVTSCWFVALGLFHLVYVFKAKVKEKRFPVLLVLGLIFGMCADVLLGIEFMLGIVFFALGHVLYLAAFCALEKPRGKDLAFILPLAALSLYIVAGTPFIRVNDPVMEKLLLGYAVIIACMLGKAAGNFAAKKSAFRALVLLGSVLFWFSDFMLAIDLFGKSSRLTWILCSYTYWPAQNLLALSLYSFVREQIAENQ